MYLFNPFATDGTFEHRDQKFKIFIWTRGSVRHACATVGHHDEAYCS